MLYKQIIEDLFSLASPEKAQHYARFFKTEKGGYGEGDVFIGLTNPQMRSVAKQYFKLIDFEDIQKLLENEYHEVRLTAFLILVAQYEKAKTFEERQKIALFYLKNKEFANNWDLVDLTAYKILGHYTFEIENTEILQELSDNESLWDKRIAIISTMFWVKKDQYEPTKTFVLNNLTHPHDLMHKANGWLLREMGKRNEQELRDFLEIHHHNMPRTTLRYAIEKFSETDRQYFLKLGK